jgi:hypothetical protein
MVRISRFALVVTALGLLAGGCGGGSAVKRVRGVVHLDNQPLGGVLVKFQPKSKDDPQASGFVAKTDPDGTFEVKPGPRMSIVPGTYTVTITKSPELESGGGADRAAVPPGGVPQPGETPKRGKMMGGGRDWTGKYGDPNNPQFTRDIVAGDNEVKSFELTAAAADK